MNDDGFTFDTSFAIPGDRAYQLLYVSQSHVIILILNLDQFDEELTRSVTRASSMLLSSTDIIFTSQTIVNIIDKNVTIHDVVPVPLLKTDTITYIYNKT